MKQFKRLLSLSLALVLAFCTLSAGMVVHADWREADASEVFSYIKINGEEINLEKCPREYDALDSADTTCTIEWAMKSGWKSSDNALYYYTAGPGTEVKNGGSITTPKKGTTFMGIDVWRDIDGGYSDDAFFHGYNINFYCGKPAIKDGCLWAGCRGELIRFENLPYSAPVVSMKSSKPDIIEAEQNDRITTCSVRGKKIGKSVITVTMTINGEDREFSCNYSMKKYPNPFASLKVGGKKVNFKKNPDMYDVKGSKAKTKLEFKTAKGWKFESGTCITNKTVKVKNGSTVKIPKGKHAVVYLNLVNSKKERFQYEVFLQR